MTITASLVKELREKTNVGMMEGKKHFRKLMEILIKL